MKIVGYCISNGIIANSDNNIINNGLYLNWLLRDNVNSIKVFYHLDFCVANLLKIIGITKEEGEELNTKGRLSIPPYKLDYVRKKYFSIKRNDSNEFCFFSDGSQYVKWFDSKSLEDCNRDKCLSNAKEAQKIGQEVYNTLCDLNLKPTTLTSPIRVWEKEVLDKIDLPTVDDLPEDIGEYAYECAKHNWVEAFQIGHWDKTWDYDLVSAYPSQISNLVDTRLGDWERVEYWNPKAYYGYYKCEIDIKNEFNPIIMLVKKSNFNTLRYTPTGERDEYLNQKQINFIDYWKLGKVKVINGKTWIPNQELKYTLRNHIQWLYRKKEQANGMAREIIKRIPNGIYGKMLETRNGQFGDHFNPVYGAEIEIPIQLKDAELCLSNGVLPIHIAVDGVLSDRELKLPKEEGIGSWKLSGVQHAICVGSGVVAVKDKEKSGDFSLDYDWLREEIEKNPNSKEYQMTKSSPVTLAKAIAEDRWDSLGSIEEISKVVDIGYESKRIYWDKPETGEELINGKFKSNAIDCGTIMIKELEDNHESE